MREKLQRIVDKSKSLALFWSAGNDSTLILATLRDMNAKFSILQRRDLWTKEQTAQADRFIKEWDLTVYSYPASNLSFIGDGEQISLVSEYVVGQFKVPSVMDVTEGTKCIAELPKTRMEYSPCQFTDYIVGTKKIDRHYVFGDVPLAKSEIWKLGDVTFHAPLYNFTNEQVLDGLRTFNIEPKKIDEGNLECCSLCLRPNETGHVMCPKEQAQIPVVNWRPELNLSRFRAAYQN